MRLIVTVSLGAFLVVAAPAPRRDTEWTVYLRRAGPIRIGMSVVDVRRVLNDPDAHLAWGDSEPDNSECAYLQSTHKPKQLEFMFQKGKLVRIDVEERGVQTSSGAEVGDSEDRIKELYKDRLQVEPHFYSPEHGHYLNYIPVESVDRPFGMVFETFDGVVTSYRIGTRAAIALVEGCS